MSRENVTWAISTRELEEWLSISEQTQRDGGENSSLADFARITEENERKGYWRAVWDEFRNWLLSAA
jgi:hypothetical protein